VIVPIEDKLDDTTVLFSVVPVRVPAAAVTVISDDPLNEVPLISLAAANVVAVDALPVSAPTKVVEVTETNPTKVVTVAPNATAVEPIVTELFNNLALAIEPANIVLVTVPVSPVVITVPEIAGNVIVVVPAIAEGIKVVVPDVDPDKPILRIPVIA
jgi:hypothetical protein